jgi:hypothetical protein
MSYSASSPSNEFAVDLQDVDGGHRTTIYLYAPNRASLLAQLHHELAFEMRILCKYEWTAENRLSAFIASSPTN